MSKTFERYGAEFPGELNDLQVEMVCIRKGGVWENKAGKKCGEGLFFHYRRMHQLAWPEEDHHRWSDLILGEIIGNVFTILMGCKDSGKTHGMTKFALCDYWCFPEKTLIIVSSTTVASLEGRIWGDMKSMFRSAKDRWPELAGNVIDNKKAICTDDINDEDTLVRDMRKGILCIACKTSSGADNSNISNYVGYKQVRRRYFADEFQFMSNAMFGALANVNSGDFKMVVGGNPTGQDDPLDKMSEPKEGWQSVNDISKTTVWENRLFSNSKTVCLYGLDSPNFDYPESEPTKYPYMINRDSIARVVSGYGKDSIQYWQMCVGMRRVGLDARRILTRLICDTGGAFNDVIWDGEKAPVKIFALDAAYGGTDADRCVGGYGEFGKDVSGKIVLKFWPPMIVPVSVRKAGSPEDQIAEWTKNFCQSAGIPPENCFYDSTGRGSLGTAFARLWSNLVNPVEFGGAPSKRPTSLDHFIYDLSTGERRIQTCEEAYLNFVTELWYSMRYAVEAGQVRSLPQECAAEFFQREWLQVRAKIQVEPKSDMKLRTGRSPDYADWCFTGETEVSTPFGNVRIDHLKPGDLVVTPMGVTPIFEVRIRQSDNLTKVSFSDGRTITGLGEHKVFTFNRGWARLDSLVIDDDLDFCYHLAIWNTLNQLFTQVKNTTFKLAVGTIQEKAKKVRRRDFYTELSGLNITGIFLKIVWCITKMGIGEITQFLISKFRTDQNMPYYTFKTVLSTCAGLLRKLLPLEGFLQPSGTIQKKAEYGMVKTQHNNGAKNSQDRILALSAGQHICQWDLKNPCIAPKSVEIKDKQTTPRTTFREVALCAVKALLFLSILKRKPAPLTVERLSRTETGKIPVYNLTLCEHNAYYANGVLVENCVIVLEGARRKGFAIGKLGVATAGSSQWLSKLEEESRKFQRSGELVEV